MKISFSVPGLTSHEARLSNSPYRADAVAQAVRKYAAAHPNAVTPAAGGLEKVEAWPDAARSTPQRPLLVSAPVRGWYLVEPRLLEQGGDDAFLVECPAAAKGAECIRHRTMAGMSVEIGITAADLQQWSAADATLRTTLFSLLSACIP